ncbi:MAG TPA: RodZ domain-containing protein [Bryobacteraceae bacterium]|jgi:cytoskeletal protein RodZ|nr:RodZ domain-containing protein [Bryobacteraceae bacterium]
MQSVGQKLRAARLAQGCTLEQVHSSTRISLKTLEAIEADDVSRISSAFLYRSFVRQVAEYLNLDFRELSESIDTSEIPQPRMPGEEPRATFTASVPALRIGHNRKRSRWLKPVASFAVAMVACSGLYALWQQQKLHLPALLGDSAPSVRTQPPAPAPASTPTAAVNGTAPAPAQQPSANPEGFTLQLSATEPAWLSIVTDGRVSFRGILERAETKVLEGHQTARIRTGNAGALEAVFNGKPIGTLGSRGQVRTVVFTRDDYEVLDSSPRISLLRFDQTVSFQRNISLEPETGAAF